MSHLLFVAEPCYSVSVMRAPQQQQQQKGQRHTRPIEAEEAAAAAAASASEDEKGFETHNDATPGDSSKYSHDSSSLDSLGGEDEASEQQDAHHQQQQQLSSATNTDTELPETAQQQQTRKRRLQQDSSSPSSKRRIATAGAADAAGEPASDRRRLAVCNLPGGIVRVNGMVRTLAERIALQQGGAQCAVARRGSCCVCGRCKFALAQRTFSFQPLRFCCKRILQIQVSCQEPYKPYVWHCNQMTRSAHGRPTAAASSRALH